jgi:hypothetical protein
VGASGWRTHQLRQAGVTMDLACRAVKGGLDL